MQETPNAHCFRIEQRSALEVSDEERQAIYQAAWDKGGLQFRATFDDLLRDKEANDTAATFIKHKIQQVVQDPEVAALLSDIDHPFAAKRPPIDSHYFETFNRDNVQLG
jgi:cation diffusion facilitator CzcD-associated flavoprotein CzcO